MPEKLPDLSGTRVLIATGSRDRIVPREQPKQLLDLFRRSHAEAIIHWQESTHALAEPEVPFANVWISKLKFQR
jgi:predicted esterase